VKHSKCQQSDSRCLTYHKKSNCTSHFVKVLPSSTSVKLCWQKNKSKSCLRSLSKKLRRLMSRSMSRPKKSLTRCCQRSMRMLEIVHSKLCLRRAAVNRVYSVKSCSTCTKPTVDLWVSAQNNSSSCLTWASTKAAKRVCWKSLVMMFTNISSTSQVFTKCKGCRKLRRQVDCIQARLSCWLCLKCLVSSPWIWRMYG
jgi:hypothetical protein